MESISHFRAFWYGIVIIFMAKQYLKTWVEIDKKAALSNVKAIRGVLKKKTKLYAVVKSNAYGHGLRQFSSIVKDKVDGFCVDSVYEGEALRNIGIKKPILVLGPTISKSDLDIAAENNLEITVSTFESLKQLSHSKDEPCFHIKVDTGMHRQGFFISDLPSVISAIKKKELGERLKGVYTHFASAKDIGYPDFTNRQIEEFRKTRKKFKSAGFGDIIFHSSATGGTILYPQAHFDMVRVGIGLYGYWPSDESAEQYSLIWNKKLNFKPVLSWKALVSEVKKLKSGDFVGYDMTEKMRGDTTVAIIPIGYWHGLRRAFSHRGQVIIRGRLCRILGRVSMDLIIVECGSSAVRVGDTAIIIGEDKNETLAADDLAEIAETIKYEILTSINPLIKRIVV
jgi:alanine racemase